MLFLYVQLLTTLSKISGVYQFLVLSFMRCLFFTLVNSFSSELFILNLLNFVCLFVLSTNSVASYMIDIDDTVMCHTNVIHNLCLYINETYQYFSIIILSFKLFLEKSMIKFDYRALIFYGNCCN